MKKASYSTPKKSKKLSANKLRRKALYLNISLTITEATPSQITIKKGSYSTPKESKKLRRKALYKAAVIAFNRGAPDNVLTESELASKYGISKAQRQYAKRYGGIDVLSIVQTHKQHTLET